ARAGLDRLRRGRRVSAPPRDDPESEERVRLHRWFETDDLPADPRALEREELRVVEAGRGQVVAVEGVPSLPEISLALDRDVAGRKAHRSVQEPVRAREIPVALQLPREVKRRERLVRLERGIEPRPEEESDRGERAERDRDDLSRVAVAL